MKGNTPRQGGRRLLPSLLVSGTSGDVCLNLDYYGVDSIRGIVTSHLYSEFFVLSPVVGRGGSSGEGR